MEIHVDVIPLCMRCERQAVAFDDQHRPLCSRHSMIFITAPRIAAKGAEREALVSPEAVLPEKVLAHMVSPEAVVADKVLPEVVVLEVVLPETVVPEVLGAWVGIGVV